MSGIWNAISDFFVGNVGLTLSIVMVAVFALLLGAFALWKHTGDATKPILMVVLAAVAVMNVLIWTLPTSDGTAPIDKVSDR